MSGFKLHLGCGKRYLAGYTHVDLADFPHIDVRTRVDKLPFDNESAEIVYASHVLEYFDRVEVVDVLKEWSRVLKPGGIIRLAVPDFEGLLQVYNRYHDLNKIIGPLYGRWPVPGTDMTVYHKTVYDYESLRTVLMQAGFKDVRYWDWRHVFQEEYTGYDDHSQAYVPHMDKERGILVSLNLEAVK